MKQTAHWLSAVALLALLPGCAWRPGPAGGSNIPGRSARSAAGPAAWNDSTDICAQFDKTFVAAVLGPSIVEASRPQAGVASCEYRTAPAATTNNVRTVSIILGHDKVSDLRSGIVGLGGSTATDQRIKMDHFIRRQADGTISSIYLVLDPNRYIYVTRSQVNFPSEEQMVLLASKVAEALK